MSARVKKHPWAGLKGPIVDFLKLVDELARQRSHREVFHHFLEAAFCVLVSPVMPAGERRDAVEDRYRKVMALDERYAKRLPELFAIAVAGIDGEFDFLGPIAGHLAALNAAKGQFFTPWPLCQLLAHQTIDADLVKACVDRNGFITVQEPAIGSGAIALAAAERIRELGFDPGIHLWLTGIDVAMPCVQMAYIQLSLRGVAADIVHGDALSDERWGRYPTLERVRFAIHHGERLQAYLANPANYLQPVAKPQPAQPDLFGDAA